MADVTTHEEASRLLLEASRLRASVAGAARTRYVAWLVGMAAATASYYAALAAAAQAGGEEAAAVGIPSVGYGVVVAGLSLGLLPAARAAPRGFARRWVTALSGWGVAYATTLTLGLTLFRDEPLYWLPAAVVAVAPLVHGARREMRA